MKLILDIETAGALTPGMTSFLFDQIKVDDNVEPDGRLTDPVKIAADIARKEAKILNEIEKKKTAIVDKAALKASRGKIIAMGLHVRDDDLPDQDSWGIAKVYRDDEGEMLKYLWAHFKNPAFKELITYNGFNFDLPYCIQRSMMLGIKVPANVRPLFLNKYKDHHVDLMQLWTCGVYGEYASLKELCIAFGIEPPVGDGADVPRLYVEGDMESIVAHCRDDLRATKELYERMT